MNFDLWGFFSPVLAMGVEGEEWRVGERIYATKLCVWLE